MKNDNEDEPVANVLQVMMRQLLTVNFTGCELPRVVGFQVKNLPLA